MRGPSGTVGDLCGGGTIIVFSFLDNSQLALMLTELDINLPVRCRISSNFDQLTLNFGGFMVGAGAGYTRAQCISNVCWLCLQKNASSH